MINLKTHKVYPEVQVDTETGTWVGKLIARNGEAKENYKGKVSTQGKNHRDIRASATKAAYAKFNLVLTKYEV